MIRNVISAMISAVIGAMTNLSHIKEDGGNLDLPI
jgi:hypothetical protein